MSNIQKSCEEGEKKLDSDFCAQWFAAQAARDAADWSKAQAFLGVLGTLFVAVSLYFAWSATRSAADAVNSANGALDIARTALALPADANRIATDALHQDRGMAKLAFGDLLRAREPNVSVVAIGLDDD